MPRFNFDRYQRPGRGIFLYMKSHPAIFNSIAVIMGVFIFLFSISIVTHALSRMRAIVLVVLQPAIKSANITYPP